MTCGCYCVTQHVKWTMPAIRQLQLRIRLINRARGTNSPMSAQVSCIFHLSPIQQNFSYRQNLSSPHLILPLTHLLMPRATPCAPPNSCSDTPRVTLPAFADSPDAASANKSAPHFSSAEGDANSSLPEECPDSPSNELAPELQEESNSKDHESVNSSVGFAESAESIDGERDELHDFLEKVCQ